MPKVLGKHDKTYTKKRAEIEARDLRWAGYSASLYEVKKGIHKGRFRIHISEDKRKRKTKSKSRPKPSGKG